MYIKHLALSHFRNHKNTDVALAPGVVLLIGENGQGKTNLVEAISYASTLASHRVAGYQPLIMAGQNSALARMLVTHDGRDVLLELELNRESPNRARLNRADVARWRDVLGTVQSVTFAPEDLDIVKRDPSNRRAFIDDLVVQTWPRFGGIYSDYDRVLRQRNTLLRSARQTGTRGTALSTLDAWDASLITYGAQIIEARADLIGRLKPLLTNAYQAIAIANNEPNILIKSSILGTQIVDDEDSDGMEFLDNADRAAIESAFSTKLASVRDKELERGITLIGPHRDDLVLMLGELPAKGYASHGESWSYALALRLASAELLKAESRTGDPVLILDDVFAELDAGRRRRLAELVAGYEQVLITAAAEEDVPVELQGTTFHVKRGTVTGEGASAGSDV
jgi:DNA replication and repair protein RecF